MNDNPQRKYTKNDIEWAEWRGKVSQSLEDMCKDLKEVKSDVKKLDKRMTGVQVRVGAIGGIIALIITVTLNFLRGIFSGK